MIFFSSSSSLIELISVHSCTIKCTFSSICNILTRMATYISSEEAGSTDRQIDGQIDRQTDRPYLSWN